MSSGTGFGATALATPKCNLSAECLADVLYDFLVCHVLHQCHIVSILKAASNPG